MNHKITILLALTLMTIGGCNSSMQLRSQVPNPRTSIPYGYVAVFIDPGPTLKPVLNISRIAFFDRNTPIFRSGLFVFKLNEGEWRIRVGGTTAEPEVVVFGEKNDTPPPVDGKRMWWPEKGIVIKVKPNHLTNAGKICAHTSCTQNWSPMEISGTKPWADVHKLIIYTPPKPKKKSEPEKNKGEAKKTSPKVSQ